MRKGYEPIEIRHPLELDGLSVLPIRRRPGQRRVTLNPGLVPGETRGQLERELNRRLFACGCPESTIGILLALILYAVWTALADAGIPVTELLGRGLLAVLIGACAGKLFGLVRAEARLKETIRKIRAAAPKHGSWEHTPLPGDPSCY